MEGDPVSTVSEDGDSPTPSQQDANNKTRNYDRCHPCRLNKKRCIFLEGKDRCELCIKKNRICSIPQRVHMDKIMKYAFAEYTITLLAVQALLLTCREQCVWLIDVARPWPNFDIFSKRTFFCRSPQLSYDLSDLTNALTQQCRLLDQTINKVCHGGLALWAGRCLNETLPNITFSPEKLSAESSINNASNVAECVQFAINPSNVYNHMSQDSIVERKQRYEKTASNVREILSMRFFQFAQMWECFVHLSKAFPASHIAYMNGDSEVALDLWSTSTSETDILKRSLAHLVSANGDLRMLQNMILHNPMALLSCVADLRGMTPLALTICSGSEECFDLLQRFRFANAWRNPTEITYRWLDLAIASGSTFIVRELMRMGYALAPYTSDVLKIIELGEAKLADCLVPLLNCETGTTQEEVNMLTVLAERREQELEEEYLTMIRAYQRESLESRNLLIRKQNMNALFVRLCCCDVQKVTGPSNAILSLQAL